MHNAKLLKSILIPTLGISAIGSIAAVSTSCESDKLDKPYVVITANADSTLTLNNYGGNSPNLQYSTDGTSWNTYSEEISINQGQKIYLRGNNPNGWSHSYALYSTLLIEGDVSISGNVMALLDNGAKTGEEGDITDIPCDYCFFKLFYQSDGITSVSENFLPATTLANECYQCMFYQCTSLTTAPDLPAINLADSCYINMFSNCSSLTAAPELPAMTLAGSCYQGMFIGCTSLTTAPELPATTLANGCYQYMFSNCSSLNSVKIAYEGNYNASYFAGWVDGVANSGTFYYNGTTQNAQDFEFPSGWETEHFN